MKTPEEIKKMLSENKEELRRKYGVKILGVFGSYARNEQDKKSDVDILVEIEKQLVSNSLSYGTSLKRCWG